MVCIAEGKCEACGGIIEVARWGLPEQHIEIGCRQPTDCTLRRHLAMIGRRIVDGKLERNDGGG
jgi:hypothetical protein